MDKPLTHQGTLTEVFVLAEVFVEVSPDQELALQTVHGKE
jgi:hypothetical protein